MTGWLIDTNVLSELRRLRPNQKVLTFINAQKESDLFVSAMTLAEIRFGIERVEDVARRTALRAWLEGEIRPWFGDRIIDADETVLLQWRMVLEEGRARGYTFSGPDALIAACALVRRLVVVTRDTKEFREAGAAVFQPWTGERMDGRKS